MSELVSRAFDLVLYGMGSVFVFLTILVGTTMLMSYLVGTEVVTEDSDAATGSVDGRILAVISAAVKQYRADRK